MGIQQINQSFQNDGNFSQLDLKDLHFDGLTMRIETFRSSHPAEGEFYVTAAGTNVKSLVGEDHLQKESNQVFRHAFSVEDRQLGGMVVTLEFREKFFEDGSWEIKMRDTDYRSSSFGTLISCYVSPCLGVQRGNYKLVYEIYSPNVKANRPIVSPLEDKINALENQLSDISEKDSSLGNSVAKQTIFINLKTPQVETDAALSSLVNILQEKNYSTFVKNVEDYQRFGDFRDKCIHSGQNLIGNNPQLASEYMLVRPYRASMILLGRLFDQKMAKKQYTKVGFSLWSEKEPLKYDPKPGVYTVFILAHVVNIEIYQLGLDKVHSDYGGIPLKLQPGSKLENGAKPVKSAYRANQTLAEVAVAFYEPNLATRLK